MIFKNNFVEILKILRKNKNLTQKEVAEMSNIPLSMISKYEQGTNKPSLENLYKIARFYEKDIYYFLDSIQENELNEYSQEIDFLIENEMQDRKEKMTAKFLKKRIQKDIEKQIEIENLNKQIEISINNLSTLVQKYYSKSKNSKGFYSLHNVSFSNKDKDLIRYLLKRGFQFEIIGNEKIEIGLDRKTSDIGYMKEKYTISVKKFILIINRLSYNIRNIFLDTVSLSEASERLFFDTSQLKEVEEEIKRENENVSDTEKETD